MYRTPVKSNSKAILTQRRRDAEKGKFRVKTFLPQGTQRDTEEKADKGQEQWKETKSG
jgi:hypothetical protein